MVCREGTRGQVRLRGPVHVPHGEFYWNVTGKERSRSTLALVTRRKIQ